MIIVKNGETCGHKLDGIPDGKYVDIHEYCLINGTTEGQIRQWIHRGKLVGTLIFGKNYFAENAEPVTKRAGRPPKKHF